MVLNTVLYPRLMWNSRFASLSGDPFDNSDGFLFPAPEGLSLSFLPHLLTAQAFIPPTERTEMAGFGPNAPATNDGIRAAVVARLNANSEYRQLFADIFSDVHDGGPITYEMLARAIAEFVRDGLHDPNATPERLRQLIPDRLPSGRPLHIFE